MGHATHTEIVPMSAISEKATGTPSSYGYRYAVPSRVERAVSYAVARWRDEEADRWDDARVGSIETKPIMAEELVSDDHLDEVRDGRSVVIPLMERKHYEIKEKTVTVKLDNDEWQKYISRSSDSYGVLLQKLKEALPELAGSISQFNVVTEKPTNFFMSKLTDGWTIRSSVSADASGGKAVTRYYLSVVSERGTSLFKENYPSQAEARAAGLKLMEDNIDLHSVDVVPKTLREDGTNVVKITRTVKSATAKVLVSYVKLKAGATPTADRWMVAFDYHS